LERIKEERLNNKLTLEQLAQKVSSTRQTIHRYETGEISNIPSDKIEAISVALKTSPQYLMGWVEDSVKEKILDKFKLFQDPVSAGLGSWLSEGTEYNYVEIEHPPIDADFALKVRGDSMSPLYNDDEVVFVKANVLVEPGQVGIFLLNGEGYLKQWQGNRLLSLNNKYEPINITEYDTFMIIGKVVMKKQ
jgi:repressor LexA